MREKIQNISIYTDRKSKKSFLNFELCAIDVSRTRGFTLFYAMLISSLLLAIGLAIFNITYKEYILTSGIRESESAFYAADSALECALYWDFVYKGSPTPAFGFYGDSLASGLQGYWRFEEDVEDQDKIFDSSGTGNNGDVTPTDVGRVSGEIGNALSFDGVAEYAQTEKTTVLSGPFTISMWVKPEFVFPAPPATAGSLLIGGTGKIGFRVNSGGTVDYRFSNAGGAATYVPMDTPLLNDGSWHLLVFRRDEFDGVDLFVDGDTSSPVQFGTKSGNFNFSYFGQNGGGANFYSGGLDDVRAYNRALSETEIERMEAKTSNNVFVQPVAPVVKGGGGTELVCAGQVINDPSTGWNMDVDGKPSGWDITSIDPVGTKTVFDISFDDGGSKTCALVEVTKRVDAENDSSTEIVSRGYNTCDLNSTRRLERALRATY